MVRQENVKGQPEGFGLASGAGHATLCAMADYMALALILAASL